MVHDVAQGGSIVDRVRIDRVLADRGSTISSLGTELPGGDRVVLKELNERPVRTLPTADANRSAWTRLVLPSAVEPDDGVVRVLRSYVPGEPLDRALGRGPAPVRVVLGIALDLLRALDALHRLGVVHGAIAPSNVIVSDDRAWLVDPSISDPGADPWRPGEPWRLEAAGYLSPEQSGVLNVPVDPRSDLYAAGVLLFECLSGRSLYDANDTAELLRAQVLESARSLRARGIDVPRPLDEIVARLLRKDPRDRYATAAGVLQDLLDLERGLGRGDPDPLRAIGAGDVRSTLADPGLVGRTEDLARIERLLDRARRGRGRLVRLEAASGDGKSRILEEIAAGSLARGERVLRAEAHELEAPRPFAMLDGLAASVLDAAADDPAFGEHLRLALEPWTPELRAALPSLGSLLGLDANASPVRASEDRLQDAVVALFDALGTRSRPAVLLLDDCQWADDLSLGVLARWAADPRDRSVTVVASIRTDEDPGATGSWTDATTVTLGPLDPTATRDLVSSMAGPIPEEAHAVIAHLSGGRPFFVTSVLHGMVESSALRPGPTGWQMDTAALASLTSSGEAATLVTRRLGRLPEETLGFLSAAAILGRHPSVAESASLAEVDVDRVDAILDGARRTGLVWPSERWDSFSFIHDKVREGALGRLSADERRDLHLRAAVLIERTRPDDVFDLAFHFDRAEAPERALVAALAAASRARERGSLESEETMLRIASRGVRDEDVPMRARIAVQLGELLMRRGAYAESERWLGLARSLVPTGPEGAVIQGTLGELAFKRGDVRTAGEAIERALRMIGRRVPTTTLALAPLLLFEVVVQMLHGLLPRIFVGRRSVARSAGDLLASRFHGRLGYAWWFERSKVATLWTHLRSLNLAERYGPSPELAQAYAAHAPAMMLIPWHGRGVRYAQRSHAIRVALGDLRGQGQSLHFWGSGLYAASAFDASLERMREALELLERTGDRWERNNCRLQIAMARYRQGDLAGAVEDSKAARRAGIEIGDAQARGIGLEGWAKATDGQIPEHLIRSELERSSEDVLTLASVMQAEGVRLLGAGRPDAAVEAFDESQRLFRRAGMKNAGVGPVRPWLVTALRRAAEAAPVVDRRRRTALLRRARSVARQASRRARLYRNDLPHVLRERAHLAALGGRRRRARSLFERSLDVATRQDARAEALRTRIARAEVGEAFGWTAHRDDGIGARHELEHLIEATGYRGAPRTRTTLSLADRFETILVHGRRIASALQPAQVESAALDAAGVLLRAERVRMLRLHGSELRDVRTSEAVDDPVAWRAIEDSRATSWHDEHDGSAVAAPILVRGRTVGCLLGTHPDVPALFGEEEEQLLGFVCALAGAALENAAGFDEVRALSRTLERRVAQRTAELARSNEALSESLARLETANEELRELDRMKDEFVSMVSHELRTPLTSVLGFASTLLAIPGELGADEVRTCVEIIERQSRRLTRLVENLLELSRLDRGALRVATSSYDVRELIDVALQEVPELEDPVGVDAPRGMRVLADRDCFTQIMINLLSNADRHGEPPYRIEVTELDGWIEVAVTDRGAGVPPGFEERLFERFQQVDAGPARTGMGLGLSIVASLARNMRGDVRYEANRPAGSRFVLRLPSAG